MNDAPNPTPAGWFPDPLARHEHRYFNGQSWTADVADAGHRRVDPLGTSPGAGGGAGPQQSGQAGAGGGATAALVCGIIGVLIAWIPFLVAGGLVLAILALVFGIRGIRRSTVGAPGRGKAVAGTVLGAIGLALSAIGIWLTVAFSIAVSDFMDPAANSAQTTSCTIDGSVVEAEGTVINLSDSTADFTVFVEISLQTGQGSNAIVARSVVPLVIDAVAAGETADWQAVDTNRDGATRCTAAPDVYGPFPFGIEVEQL